MGRPKDLDEELPRVPGRHGCGNGLWLNVRDPEHRSWVFRYSFKGRPREMGLGSVDRVSIEDARADVERWREVLRKGDDPIKVRNRNRGRDQTFQTVAEIFLATHEQAWSNATHRHQWHVTLETYAYPVLGKRSISAITRTTLDGR
jgi:hypothetical protein